jgi:hypothetical protein
VDYSQYKQLEFRRKFWKFFGATIHMTTAGGAQELGVTHMKAFKLRSDITMYADNAKQTPVIHLKARQIVAFNYVFDVTDAQTGQPLFSLERKGLRSAFVRDHWLLHDVNGNQFGEIVETSSQLALIRRWVGAINELVALVFAFVPETYTLQLTTGLQPQPFGMIVHRKNPFIVKMALDTSMAQANLDPRLAIASTLLLAIRDASKNG